MPNIEPPLVTQTKTIYGPTLKHTLKPSLVTRAKTIYAPTVQKVALGASATGRSRRLAYVPRLDLAITAGPSYLSRGRQGLRPRTLTDRSQQDKVVAVTQVANADSTSYAWQGTTQSYPSDNANTANQRFDTAAAQ